MSDYAGIDYGLGTSNIDTSNGIRYGVISQHTLMPEALDDMEMYYGEPHCPVCGNEALSIPSHTEQSSNGVAVYSDVPPEMEDWPNYSTHGCADYSCATCEHTLDSSEVYSEEALGFSYFGPHEFDSYPSKLTEDEAYEKFSEEIKLARS